MRIIDTTCETCCAPTEPELTSIYTNVRTQNRQTQSRHSTADKERTINNKTAGTVIVCDESSELQEFLSESRVLSPVAAQFAVSLMTEQFVAQIVNPQNVGFRIVFLPVVPAIQYDTDNFDRDLNAY